jgi:hypothetical protein
MKARMKEAPVSDSMVNSEENKTEVQEKVETKVEEVTKEKQMDTGLNTPISYGTTTQAAQGYYQQTIINEGAPGNLVTRERVHSVLDNTEDKNDITLFKKTSIGDNIDRDGYYNYTIDVDLVSAYKIRFILETVRSSGNMFVGPKNKICLVSKDGEVFYKSKDELSIDSFIALCIVFNV